MSVPLSAVAQGGDLEGGEPGDDGCLQHEPDGADGGGGAGAGDDGDDAADRPQHVGGDDRLDRCGADPRTGAGQPDGDGVDEQEGPDPAEQGAGDRKSTRLNS